jgi:hypothetical protein
MVEERSSNKDETQKTLMTEFCRVVGSVISAEFEKNGLNHITEHNSNALHHFLSSRGASRMFV